MSGFINWGHESDSQREMRRRFDEMIFEQARLRAMSNAQGGVGGGRLQRGITSAQTAFVDYINTETGTWEFFCASPIDGAFSEPVDTQIPDTFGRYGIYPLNLGGYCAVYNNNGSSWDIYFISASGVVLNRLEIPTSSSLDINLDHNVNQVLIVDNDSRVLWVWDGTTLYSHSDVLQDNNYSIGTNGDSFIANGSLIVRTTTEPVNDRQEDTWYFIKDGVATAFDTHEWGPDDYRRQFAAFSGSNNMISWSYEVATNVITGYGIINENGEYSASGPIPLVGITNINWDWYSDMNNIWITSNDNDNLWMFNWDSFGATNTVIPRLASSNLSISSDKITAYSEYDRTPSTLLAAAHGEWTDTYYTGGLRSVNDFTLIYKFPGQEASSFTIAGESFFTQNAYFIGDSIFIGVLYQDNFRFIKLTAATPSLEEVTEIADLSTYFVPDLMFNVESYISYLDLSLSSTGIVFSSYAPSIGNSQVTHYNGGDWEVDGNTLMVEGWDVQSNINTWTECGPYMRVIDGDLVAWLPAINQWQTVLENFGEGMNVWYTRTRFNLEGRDGTRFVVTSGDGTGLTDKIVTTSQIIPILGIPSAFNSIRVGDAGVCVDYQDVDRDDLRSYKFWDFDGNLKWIFNTQYGDRNGFAFTDTRAISDLNNHQTEPNQVAIFIGNSAGAKLKELTNTNNLDYSINDAPWWD